ncbi:YggS family pyridoxal phosphate-dependent enzyme, partial [candidate division WOR-3 bacterium]|nr:YggS family pyridoxal phosphate-dependent enzyme [candidate division WOR-3 bacterium]
MRYLDPDEFRRNLRIVRENVFDACMRVSRQPEKVTILAVTKGFERSAVDMAVSEGIRDIGENRVQEALTKFGQQECCYRKHFIGHLQKNKVEKALSFFDVIQTIDSIALAEKIEQILEEKMHGIKRSRFPSFVQVNISGEKSKSGVSPECFDDLTNYLFSCKNIELKGVMGIAEFNAGDKEVRRQFSTLNSISQKYGLPNVSMGMSSDYEIAVEEGSTMIR